MIDHQLQPLKNKTVVLTRAQEQQSEARLSLENLGASVFDLPALVIGPPDQWDSLDNALAEFSKFNWIIFSSANGVQAVETRLKLIGKTLSLPPRGLQIAAVGRKTAICLENIGAVVDFVPPSFVADSLIKFFPASFSGLRILLPRVQTGGRPILAKAFSEGGANVTEVSAYESRCPEVIPDQTAFAIETSQVDAIAFTSGKTAVNAAHLLHKRFGVNWHEKMKMVKVISIGPQTSIACRKYFHGVDQEADIHDLGGLLKACIKALAD